MPRRLRLFRSTEAGPETGSAPACVRVQLRDLLPLVATAQDQNYLWLQDFLDDEVRVTADLYEVLRTFRQCRPSA